MTVLALFVVMNNLMTRYGSASKFGADIPLSVYGVISKLNNLYVSCILGISIGAQPIIGFNFGAGKYDRVKETLKKVLIIGFSIGIIFNIIFQFFPKQVVSIFISKTDPNYTLFMEFAVDCCRIFLMVCALNAFEMCCSIIIQSLGNVKKATAVSFARQIILFIPLSLILSYFIGLYGALYAALIADIICFIFVIFVFKSEWMRIIKLENNNGISLEKEIMDEKLKPSLDKKVIVTIAREYGSGGRYIGQILAQKLGIKFYDKELISNLSKQTGLSEQYIALNEQKRDKLDNLNSVYNIGLDNDDDLFINQSKLIKKIAKEESCVIVGRCSDFVLKDNKDVIKVFIYSDIKNKIKRVTKYYGVNKDKAESEINKINKLRANHYKHYTGRTWNKCENYDICLNSDILKIEATADLIYNFIINKMK